MNEFWQSTILQQLALNGNCGTQQEFCFKKSLKRYYVISIGIPNLGVLHKNYPIGPPQSGQEKKI